MSVHYLGEGQRSEPTTGATESAHLQPARHHGESRKPLAPLSKGWIAILPDVEYTTLHAIWQHRILLDQRDKPYDALPRRLTDVIARRIGNVYR